MMARAAVPAQALPAWLALRMLRPGNLAMTAVAVATGGLLAGAWTSLGLALASAAAVLVAAFGNLLNDYLDRDLDRQAHPGRALPSGAVQPRGVFIVALALLVAGLAVAFAAHWVLGAFALANAGILALYEGRLKAQGLVGNVAVGWLVASAFLFGAVSTGRAPVNDMLWLLVAMSFLATVARELQKDIEDLAADQAHRKTAPLRHGVGPVRIAAFILVQVAVLLSGFAFFDGPAWHPIWLVGLAFADVLFLVGGSLAWMRVDLAQRLLKLAMLVALSAFLFGSWLDWVGNEA